MRRVTRELVHDLKEMGIHLWMIPLVALAFIVMTYIVQAGLDAAGKQNIITLPMLEALIPSLGGYGALMLMQGLLDTEGGELVFTYPRTRLYWGLIRQFRFFILYAFLIAAVCICVTSIMRIDFAPTFYLTLAQSFAVMAVSFLGITAANRVSIGLVALVAFVGIQIMIGREFEILNWIYTVSGGIGGPSVKSNAMLIFNAIIIGIFGWGLGQVWLRPPR
ncbi:MAG: hypothetical protein SCM11_08305 [Bacillota bacterium]|nr:hypothetical protein [Bacillota bacterium]